MRFFQIIDFQRAGIDELEDARLLSRMFWLSIAWFAFAGLLAVLLAGLRGFRPINAFQIGWNGLFGLAFLVVAGVMFTVDETKTLGALELTPFMTNGAVLIAAGAGLLWLSAFAGLSTKNWWKAPLFGLLLMAVVGASIALPALLAANSLP